MSAKPVHHELGTVSLDGRQIQFRVRQGRPNGKRRLRVGIGGIEVIEPNGASCAEAQEFIQTHTEWVLAQLDRIERLRDVRKVRETAAGEILLRGVATRVSVDATPRWKGGNRVLEAGGRLVIGRGRAATTPPAKTLENWLRREARTAIVPLVARYAARVGVEPGRLYVMDQRTKWGNCSALGNLSFNWRLVMAPEPVLRYLVAHEVVHLAIPDHSQRFWLTVQSICPESERARQWLVANSHRLIVDLETLMQLPR
jgi:predicted metal-dependent hydrolase